MELDLSGSSKYGTFGRRLKDQARFLFYTWYRIIFFLIWWLCATCAVLWVYAFLSNLHDDIDDVPLTYRSLHKQQSGRDLMFDPPAEKRFRIALCAKVSDETPYLLEWIEWHRLQGVDKFAFYNPTVTGDPATADGRTPEAVQSLYSEHGMPELIDLHPAADLHPDTNGGILYRRVVTPMQAHRTQQHLMISHCVEKYREQADWILHIDPDEFVYGTSTSNSTLWSFLHGDHARTDTRGALEKFLDPLRTVGYQFQARQMGMSGRLFDYHTMFSLDTVSGRTEVYFDPRDSLRFRTFHAIQPDHAHIAQQLLLKTTPYAKQIEQEISDKIARVDNSTLLAQRLIDQIRISDAIGKLAQLTGAAKPVLLREWRAALKQMYPTPGEQPLAAPGAAELEAFTDKLHRLAETARAKSAAYSVVNLAGDSQLGVALNDSERISLIASFEAAWQPYFPLITEEQITTGPVPSDWDVALPRVWEAIFDACRPEQPCRKPPMPGWMTSLGKSIYRTKSMHRSQASRIRGALRGCLRPWVHTCAHDVLEARMPQVGPKHGVRLDHHQFRSLERRTTRLPAWRTDLANGYAARDDFDAVLRYLSLSPALEKHHLSQQVRRRIFEQFHPLPKLFDYAVVTDSATDAIRAVPINVRRDCSVLELLREVQVPCPKSHPHLGRRYVGLNRVHYFLADQFCTDAEQGDALNATFWDQTLIQSLDWSPDQADQHLRLCPGWPEARCCSSLIDTNTTIWDTDQAVLVSGKFDVWQTGLLPN